MNLKTQGFILLDVDVVALNNAGKSNTSHFDNAVATKKVFKNGKTHVYVSGQAWRFWWRDTLQKNHDWKLSPITREEKIAFTDADPINYDDDDVFGYMKAAKESTTDANGKEKKKDVTVTRVSPLKNSAIISAGSVRVAENWSSMARQEGDSVPYGKEEYSAIMKAMFSLDLFQVGAFATYNKTGFKNLTEKLKAEALRNGAIEIDDPFVKDKGGSPQKLVQLPRTIRIKRITDTIQALKTISGGAMQTSNMGDVTPKLIVLVTSTSGNHPFSHIVKATGQYNEIVSLNIHGLKQVLDDYKDQFKKNIFIGRRSGFMDDNDGELKELTTKYSNVKVDSVNNVIDNYCKEIEELII